MLLASAGLKVAPLKNFSRSAATGEVTDEEVVWFLPGSLALLELGVPGAASESAGVAAVRTADTKRAVLKVMMATEYGLAKVAEVANCGGRLSL